MDVQAIEIECETREAPIERPQTRAECIDGPRPCPWISCRYHLLIDVKPSGAVIANVKEPGQYGHRTISRHTRRPIDDQNLDDQLLERMETMSDTCALDVAERGGASHKEVGELLGIRKQSVLRIQASAKAKCKSSK